MTETRLRPSQQAVVAYTGGRMGVAAVPGSGKTFTLSYLAAKLVDDLAASGRLDDQEVLIVTFTNPAVNTFRSRIAHLVQQERGLLPYIGYRVRTLHGLAHDIVRMRPSLVGLSEGFEILDERVTAAIVRELSEQWIRHNGHLLTRYISLGMDNDLPEKINFRIRKDGPMLVESLLQEAIRIAKDKRWSPYEMRMQLDSFGENLPLAEIGVKLFEDYERALSFRGAVDFDDLVRLAMDALEADRGFLERLQVRWPYILEDEAQDSSQLQNDMLRLLSGNRNWVRVGDPNQAIYTTFTTADSNFLRQFLNERQVKSRPLPVSGRSSRQILALANRLVDWTAKDRLVSHLSNTFYPQVIEPTTADDTQQNPPDSFIYLDWDEETNITPDREIERVVLSLKKWLPDHEDFTVAVLAPENSRGFKVVEELKRHGIPYEELLRSSTATRDTASQLMTVLDFLADPTVSRRMAKLYAEVWWPVKVGEPEDDAAALALEQAQRTLANLKAPERFLWPGLEGDWLDQPSDTITAADREVLVSFRVDARRWLQASVLPIDQLILTISQDLFTQQADLALAYKIAVVLAGIASKNPDYRLPQISQELRVIANNERRFLGFDSATEGYEPRKGVVTVATMHAAKGLEWDRVYLMAVNNYSFPADLPGDSFISEKWFIRDNLNMQAEARRQIEYMMGEADAYEEGEASRKARTQYAMERMRLLYVGITRAKQDLVITWNMGRFWDAGPDRQNRAAAALIELTYYWKEHLQT